jgi:hypothetical protein
MSWELFSNHEGIKKFGDVSIDGRILKWFL